MRIPLCAFKNFKTVFFARLACLYCLSVKEQKCLFFIDFSGCKLRF